MLLIAAMPYGIAASPIPLSTIDRLNCPAELVVIQADSRRYAEAKTSALEKSGLKSRIQAAMSTLPLLCRRYLEVSDSSAIDSDQFIDGLRSLQTLGSDEDLVSLSEKLRPYLQKAPFEIGQFIAASEKALEAAEQTYLQYCGGCHENTNMSSTNPAYSLFDMAKKQSNKEFLARMLLGIRGSSEIGLSNPLTISELSAMRDYFLEK